LEGGPAQTPRMKNRKQIGYTFRRGKGGLAGRLYANWTGDKKERTRPYLHGTTFEERIRERPINSRGVKKSVRGKGSEKLVKGEHGTEQFVDLKRKWKKIADSGLRKKEDLSKKEGMGNRNRRGKRLEKNESNRRMGECCTK